MRIDVFCFASLREALGTPRLALDLPEGASVEVALAALAERHAAVRPALASLRCAVGEEFVVREHVLRDGDTLALLPPVSGG